MFILAFLPVLKSNLSDVTSAFIHSDIPEDDKVYIEITIGFEQFYKNGCKKCLKLKNMLYGLYQISHAFWYFMINKLEKCCLKQTNFYP